MTNHCNPIDLLSGLSDFTLTAGWFAFFIVASHVLAFVAFVLLDRSGRLQ